MDDRPVDLVVVVNGDIAEAHSLLEAPSKLRRNHTGLGQDVERLTHRVGRGDFKPGDETLEVAMVEEAQVPWKELAFRTVSMTLKLWFEDRRAGAFGFHASELLKR